MEPRNTRLSSRKINAPVLNKEFRFQPELEKSNKGHGSLKLGPRVRGDAI
jgi:hypothetical protein